MKITFLLPVLSFSGGIRVVAVYADWLAKRGHNVTLVSRSAASPSWWQRTRDLLHGKAWTPLRPNPRSYVDDLTVKHIVIPGNRPLSAKDVPPSDILISTWWETAEWAAKLPASCGARVYFIQHHELFDFVPRDRCQATYHLRFHKIVIAKWLSEVMSELYGDDCIDLVPNAVDHNLFYAPIRGKQSCPTLGMLFNEASFKGVDVSLKAIDLLRARYPALKVIAFSSSTPTGRYHLPDYIDLKIAPPQDSLRQLYAQCDVWLTTSRTEGFNLMAMEAMACRTPVVSTRTGWPIEGVRDSINGYLVDVDDAAGAANAVAKIFDLNDEGWLQISSNAFATVADAQWEASCMKFEDALYRARERAEKGEILGCSSGFP